MKRLRWLLLVVLGVASVSSCSRLPQSTRSNEHMTSIREEYLRNHPDGQFNALIMEGRVVKGMGIIEVLASWGLPNDRRSSGEGDSEYWAYYAKDEHTQKFVSYELVFENRMLTRWAIHADIPTALGTMSGRPEEGRTIEETLRLGQSTTTDAPKKRP